MHPTVDIHQLEAAASVSSTRQDTPVSLIVLHSDPRPTMEALAAYTDPQAPSAPHYYIAADGAIFQFVAEERAARHSGIAEWQGARRTIDLLSIGVTLEHTPGSPYPPAALTSLHALVNDIGARYGAGELSLARWASSDEGQAWGEGLLLPVELPPVPVDLLLDDGLVFGGSDGMESEDVTCVPPEPPPPDTPILGSGAPILGGGVDPAAAERFWTFLIQETYRHRSEGFQSNWAFHRFAARNDLGAPLARSSSKANEVASGGKTYGFQVFARDTVLNEIPLWTAVQSLNTLLNGAIAPGGLGRQVLEASFLAAGSPLQAGWAFHQIAVRERLGPPLSGNYRISAGGQEYALQVFAADTLYSPAPNWSDVRRLSATPPGDLATALWVETCKPGGSVYQADSPFQQAAVAAKLGVPLTGVYTVDFEGTLYSLQVFALDTLYAGPDGAIGRLSGLAKPDFIANFQAAPAVQPTVSAPVIQTMETTPLVQPGSGSPDDAMSDRRPTFMMLPLAGQPRISQFYGFTKYSRQRTDIYRATQARHSGLDFAVPDGTPLLAISHGVVLCAGTGCPFGASQPGSIVVRYGGVYAVYGHARRALVSRGQRIKPGDVIGESGTFVGPHLHFELRPVPAQALGNRDPNQAPVNPSVALNPINFFTSDLMPYFENQYNRLRGTVGEFCVGGLHDQPDTTFGGPLDTRPCTN